MGLLLRRLLVGSCAVVAATAGSTLIHVVSASAGPSGTVAVINRQTNECLTVTDLFAGGNVYVRGCDNTASQAWRFIQLPAPPGVDPAFVIKPLDPNTHLVRDDLCLDVIGSTQ
jgi:hypothetical protein